MLNHKRVLAQHSHSRFRYKKTLLTLCQGVTKYWMQTDRQMDVIHRVKKELPDFKFKFDRQNEEQRNAGFYQ